MSSNLQNLMPSSTPNHHINHYNHSNNKIMHNNHNILHPSNTCNTCNTSVNKPKNKNQNQNKNKSPSPPIHSILHESSIKFPIPAAITYRSPLNPKNRKRVRAINDNYSSLSPNINNSLKRQRRKLQQTPQIQLPSLVSVSVSVSVSPTGTPKNNKNKIQRNSKRNIKNNRNNRNNTNTNTNNKSMHKNVEDWSETDMEHDIEQDYTDDDYLPPPSRSTKNGKTSNSNANDNDNNNDNDNDNDNDVVGYRRLNWRKKQVATPKFILIDRNDSDMTCTNISNLREIICDTPSKLKTSASTMDMYGVLGDKLEDTSNEAYFYRHYRAEAREKLFYEELFESRLKQQQILEEKEKRKKKKQKRTRKKSKKNKSKSDMDNNENNDNDNDNDIDGEDDIDIDIDINSDCDNYDNDNDCIHIRNDSYDNDNDGEDCMDLTLPKLPTGPWSYKLGAKYDKRPQVPKNVKNRPTFNYNIPFEKLQRKQFITNLEEKKKLDNWWKMPPNLIRRTDYGNMANIKVKINPNMISLINNNGGDLKKKQELIELYQQLKQKMKKSDDKKTRKKKHKHKKKDKYNKKNKEKNKNKNKNKNRNKNKDKHKNKNCKDKNVLSGGPVDVRLLLKK